MRCRRQWFSAGMLLLVLASAATAWGERPAAPKLLPESTLAYVRIADSKVLVERFQQTSMGRIGQDDQVRPLIGQLYSSVGELFAQIEDEVGLPLDKILSLPQGEICLAVTAPPAGQPALFFIFEAGDNMPAVQKLLDKGTELAMNNGATKETEVVGDVQLITYTMRGDGDDKITYFEKDGVLVFGTHFDQLRELLDAWNGNLKEDVKTLADNRKFTTIMNRSMGPKDDPPQITWFVDPVALAKTAGRGNITAQAGLALLPAIGLDGLQGIGGSMTMAAVDFDSVMHVHILIDEPRTGVLDAIAIKSGDVTPESWVPVDASTYVTLNFDVEKSYTAIAKVYNSFRGEGALEMEIKNNINDRIELDFQQEILAAAAGRFTYMTWIEKPVRLDSNCTMLAMQLKDPKDFQETLDKLTTKFADNLEKSAYGTTPYWLIKTPQRPDRPADNEAQPGRVQLDLRAPQPCFAILGDYIVVTDRPSCLEKAIITMSDKSLSLANDLEFKLIAGKIKRQPGGEAPGMISFNRPEEGMRFLYDLALADNTKQLLQSQAESNPFFKGVDQAMKDNPLPPFAVIAKYLAPGGGFMISDETGFHYASFQLRRK